MRNEILKAIIRNAIWKLEPTELTAKGKRVLDMASGNGGNEDDALEAVADAVSEAYERGFRDGAGFFDGLKQAL